METHWDRSVLRWHSPGRPKCLASIDNINSYYDDANNDVINGLDDGQVQQGQGSAPEGVIDLLQMLPVTGEKEEEEVEEDEYACSSSDYRESASSTVRVNHACQSLLRGAASHAPPAVRMGSTPRHKDNNKQYSSATVHMVHSSRNSTTGGGGGGGGGEGLSSTYRSRDVALCSEQPFLCDQCRDSSTAAYQAQNRCNSAYKLNNDSSAYAGSRTTPSKAGHASDYRSMKLYDRVTATTPKAGSGMGRARSVERFNVATYAPLAGGGGGGGTPSTGKLPRTPGNYAQLDSLKCQANCYDTTDSCRHQQQLLRNRQLPDGSTKLTSANESTLVADWSTSSPSSSLSCCCLSARQRLRNSASSELQATPLGGDGAAECAKYSDDVTIRRSSQRSRRFRRLKALLFLLCIVAGFLAAALGVVLALLISSDVTLPPYGRSGVNQSATSDTQRAEEVLHYVTVPSSTEMPVKDQQGWVMFSGGSTNGSRYLIIDRSATFSTGQSECQKRGGHLAHVNTVREQVFLEDLVAAFPEVTKDGKGLWLGGRRARGSHAHTCMFDQWRWVDSYGRQYGVVQGFAAFGPGKPDDRYSPEECLYLNYEEGKLNPQYLRWDDAPCDMQGQNVIKILCEVELR